MTYLVVAVIAWQKEANNPERIAKCTKTHRDTLRANMSHDRSGEERRNRQEKVQNGEGIKAKLIEPSLDKNLGRKVLKCQVSGEKKHKSNRHDSYLINICPDHLNL